jgi:hypothetical protein
LICRCSAEGRAEADALLAEVKQRLSCGGVEGGRDSRAVGDSNLLSCVVYSLDDDFNAHITEIVCDQWAMVCASTDPGSDDPFEVGIPCDNVEDGIAAVWKAFADRKDGYAAGADGAGIGLAGDLPGEGSGADGVRPGGPRQAGGG